MRFEPPTKCRQRLSRRQVLRPGCSRSVDRHSKKVWLPTVVDSVTGGTSRRLVPTERRDRRPDKSAGMLCPVTMSPWRLSYRDIAYFHVVINRSSLCCAGRHLRRHDGRRFLPGCRQLSVPVLLAPFLHHRDSQAASNSIPSR